MALTLLLVQAEHAARVAAMAVLEQAGRQRQAELEQVACRLEAAEQSKAAQLQQTSRLHSQVAGLQEDLKTSSDEVLALKASNHQLHQSLADVEVTGSSLCLMGNADLHARGPSLSAR